MASINWHLVVCGINHKTSSLKERELLQLGHDEMTQANSFFRGMEGIKESIVISTCNRVEFYFVADRNRKPFKIIREFYHGFREQDISDLQDYFYTKKNKHTVDHLFRVTAGIDSMILGENQILGQIKDAYSRACSVGTAGKVIHRLFHQAFRIGKLIRTNTDMGKGACSVSSAAVELLKIKIENLDRPTLLFIGVNQMIAMAAASLSKYDYGKYIFANRTEEKAQLLARKYDATGFSLNRLPELMNKADIVITCTGSDKPIINSSTITNLLNDNQDKKLLIVDMAIPRDVGIDKNMFPSIDLYDLEDIQGFIKDQQIKRKLEVPKAEEIIDHKLDEFVYWFDHIRHEPIYTEMGDAYELIRRKEIEPIQKKLPPELSNELERASRKMVNELLRMKAKINGNLNRMEQ